MARQVYFDPFGKRLEGYQAGVKDEITMQDQTRRARAADWDHTNIDPLRLQTAQRANSLGEFAVPYLENQYGIRQRGELSSLANNELETNALIGQTTGDYSPYLATALNYGSGQSLGSENMFGAQTRAYSDVLGNPSQGIPGQEATPDMLGKVAQQFGLDPQQFLSWIQSLTGTVSNGVEQGVDQYYGFDRARQTGQDQRQAGKTQLSDSPNAQIRAMQGGDMGADGEPGYIE